MCCNYYAVNNKIRLCMLLMIYNILAGSPVLYIAMAGTHQVWVYFFTECTWYHGRYASVSFLYIYITYHDFYLDFNNGEAFVSWCWFLVFFICSSIEGMHLWYIYITYHHFVWILTLEKVLVYADSSFSFVCSQNG